MWEMPVNDEIRDRIVEVFNVLSDKYELNKHLDVQYNNTTVINIYRKILFDDEIKSLIKICYDDIYENLYRDVKLDYHSQINNIYHCDVKTFINFKESDNLPLYVTDIYFRKLYLNKNSILNSLELINCDKYSIYCSLNFNQDNFSLIVFK